MRLPAALLALLLAPAAALAAPATLHVGGTAYQHRWEDGNYHEYTPDGQDDLERYSEMLVMAAAPGEFTGDDVERYTAHMAKVHAERGGDVVSSACAPAAATHVADCTMLVVFVHEGRVETSVTKHLALGPQIVVLSLAHREYGSDAAARSKAWMASPDGQRQVAAFIDWADASGLAMNAR